MGSEMIKSLHLNLLVGSVVPRPAPRRMIDALSRVAVTVDSGGASGFQLVFDLRRDPTLVSEFLHVNNAPIGTVRVIVSVTVGGTPEILMDGVMTHHEITPGGRSGAATLTVTGEDLTRLMDRVDLSGIPYPGMDPGVQVGLILAKYAPLGIAPLVVPPVLLEAENPAERYASHQGTDLAYVKKIAADAGYVFYLTPGPAVGTSVAYWGPEIKTGPVQPALNVDMGAARNVEQLGFSLDTESKTLPVVVRHEKKSGAAIPIPVPDITPLNPPLGQIPLMAHRVEQLSDAAKFSSIKGALRAMVAAAKTADALSASGSLNVLRYGRVLKARQLVAVRGAGETFNGLYYVQSVSHTIERGGYTQEFTLKRNALVASIQKVAA
jgi:hypothetical protein